MHLLGPKLRLDARPSARVIFKWSKVSIPRLSCFLRCSDKSKQFQEWHTRICSQIILSSHWIQIQGMRTKCPTHCHRMTITSLKSAIPKKLTSAWSSRFAEFCSGHNTPGSGARRTPSLCTATRIHSRSKYATKISLENNGRMFKLGIRANSNYCVMQHVSRIVALYSRIMNNPS